MKAARYYRYGPPDVVRLEDVDRPVPTENQILVRVKAASVNRADLDGLAPKPQFVRLFMGLRAPRSHEVGRLGKLNTHLRVLARRFEGDGSGGGGFICSIDSLNCGASIRARRRFVIISTAAVSIGASALYLM